MCREGPSMSGGIHVQGGTLHVGATLTACPPSNGFPRSNDRPCPQRGQEFKHKKDGIDIVTGIKSKVKTRFGHPDWKKELGRVSSRGWAG